ncbi:MAG: hypothetical protein LJE70_21240 [Chromatiaceae bacterium]|nr:hypothetical protein [Chromatiaceae bacterium]
MIREPGATWTSQRDHLLLTLFYKTGARVSEIIAVRVADVDSCGGESGGQPRSIASPEAYVEDLSVAVDFIGTRPFVDRERSGSRPADEGHSDRQHVQYGT